MREKPRQIRSIPQRHFKAKALTGLRGEPVSGNSGLLDGEKCRGFDKNRKRGFHHAAYDA